MYNREHEFELDEEFWKRQIELIKFKDTFTIPTFKWYAINKDRSVVGPFDKFGAARLAIHYRNPKGVELSAGLRYITELNNKILFENKNLGTHLRYLKARLAGLTTKDSQKLSVRDKDETQT